MAGEMLANHIRELDAGDLRSVVQYEGDDYDVVYRRDDVATEFSDEEFEEVAKNLVLKGFDDPPEQPELGNFGQLDATVRWFQEVVVMQVPLDAWSGVIVSFDRSSVSDSGRLVDTILDYVETECRRDRTAGDDPDELADEFED